MRTLEPVNELSFITEKLALGNAAINRQQIVPEVSTDIKQIQPAVKIYYEVVTRQRDDFIQSVCMH